MQFGVEPLIAPLFDFQPNPNMFGPSPLFSSGLTVPSRPLSASSLSGLTGQPTSINGSLAPPPIMPGSALRLLNQGRAQGLFTPSTTTLALLAAGAPGTTALSASTLLPGQSIDPALLAESVPCSIPSTVQPLKRTASQREEPMDGVMPSLLPLAASVDTQMPEAFRAASAPVRLEGSDEPSLKRQRTETERTPSPISPAALAEAIAAADPPRAQTPIIQTNGVNHITVNGDEKPDFKPNTPPQPTYEARMASKPFAGRGLDTSVSLKESRRSAISAHIMSTDNPGPVLDMMRQDLPENPAMPSGIDVDVVLDDQGHTALHIAATMARLQTVQALIASGADVHRGNHSGETPLVRACLSMQCYDHQAFHRVVELLCNSIRTIDTSLKSVLHHIVSLAGVKGRSVAARYYMDSIFYWIAHHQHGDFKSIIDLQDEHGDTALNIAARVGNRGLIKTLLDVGANRMLHNKLWLRPGDFGIEVEVRQEFMASLCLCHLTFIHRSLVAAHGQKTFFPCLDPLLQFLQQRAMRWLQVYISCLWSSSANLKRWIVEMTTLVQNLSAEYNAEIKNRQDNLDVTQAHLRAATRELSEQRKQIQQWQQRCTEVDQVERQIKNLDEAHSDEDRFDWTARTNLDGQDARSAAGDSFRYRGNLSQVKLPPPVAWQNVDPGDGSEAPIPLDNTPEVLVRLRRMKMWYDRTESLLDGRVKAVQGSDTLKEFQCRKIVAMCTKIPVDHVEQVRPVL
jgi:regulatory protein SWI6